MELPLVVIVGLVIVVIILALATASIASAYSIVFGRFEQLRKKALKSAKGEVGYQGLVEEERLVLKQKLEEVLASQAGELHKILEDVKREGLKLFADVGNAARGQVQEDIRQFRLSLDAKAQQEVEKVKRELEKYRIDKQKQIDERAKSVLQDVANKVLPGAIDLDKHEQLIVQALQKAKEDKFFSS
jgi:hypothetical protein